MDPTPNAQDLLAFITPQGKVFKWKVIPFGVASAPTLFQGLMGKIRSPLASKARGSRPHISCCLDGGTHR